MSSLSPELVQDLRAKASAGASVPGLLREISRRLPADQQSSLYLLQYFRAAFYLSLKAVIPISSWKWREDGKDGISDERIEEDIRPEMEATRNLWEKSGDR